MKTIVRILALVLTVLALPQCSTSLPPLDVQPVNGHLYRFRQPQNAAEWQQVRNALGRNADIVKLNDPAEGPSGFSDDYAITLGMVMHPLAIEPKGDGPLAAQIAGELSPPDETIVVTGVGLLCDPAHVTGVHCTHGMDRTGYEVARERVACEGWTPEQAEAEWHRLAQYPPYGMRIPSPGLSAAWDKFVERQMATRRLGD